MSYLVLARKSRPQKFDQVVGQRTVVKTLKNSILRNRIAHAILFSGVRGVGKTTLARLMAKAINCMSEVADRPCDECAPCKEITTGNSLDLYEIDGASNRGIQEIRELKEKIRFLPTNSKYKIIIIDEVHMLTTEAFNALLKTLEEPPAHVFFMFATTEIHKIPITILSRCQQYELKRVSAPELFDHFNNLAKSEGYNLEPQALSMIVREAAGSVRDGLSLLDQMFSYGENEISTKDVVEVLGLVNRDVLLQITKALLDGSRKDVFFGLNEIFNYGLDLKRFMEDLLDHFRSLLLCRLDGCTELIDLPQEEVAQFVELATHYSVETIHLKLSLLMKVAEDLKFSSQPRLAIETAFLGVIEAANVVPLSTLLGSLEQILPNTIDGHVLNTEVIPATPLTQPVKKKVDQPPSPQPEQPQDDELIIEKPKIVNKKEYSPPSENRAPEENDEIPLPDEPHPDEIGTSGVAIHPHEKNIRKDWPEFIEYVRDRKVWMAQDLQRADGAKEDVEGELHLTFADGVNCSLLRQKENLHLLTEFALDFFQKSLKVKITVPDYEEDTSQNGGDSPQKKRMQLASDPLVTMAAEIFNGEVGDIRIGPRSR